ncbi:fatty acid desaturase family protein [Streptomyces triticirhizae]|uniref:Acyl-CoA desaturase n=1 Tax=Streptomyces triticirhizae TaxID=2483353 RepID=A0A3M2KSL3_9ACTN|nr:acyl-CoA desaturase [Streptomyces triticirhizae]RMI27480.1 acyl-CoA desaturase [Streptomyces triticirhizae]
MAAQPTAVITPPRAANPSATPDAGEFTPLSRLIKEQRLLDRRLGWYAVHLGANAVALAAVVAAVLLAGNSWWTVLLAVPMALFTTRTAFFGHDAGHSQIASSRKVNRALGLIHGNLLLGMSSAWWNDKHNRHHANPNHVDKDPDVGEGVLVWTEGQAEKRTGFARWLTRNQARLFFPLLLLEGIALKVASARMLAAGEGWEGRGRARATESVLLITHVVAYAALLLSTMSLGKALVFALVHHALFGLHLGAVFAPNHKGMEMPDPDVRWGHLRRQVLTSRNVRGGLLTDWMMGGLNYQIEHHLFPNMPRVNLRRAQPLVRDYCRSIGVSYAETGLVDSYRQALTHMHGIGAELRAERRAGR